ncbi:MAG: twin-arginine translocase subunit TatC [Alphaproteobacteria bacterium]
MKYLSHLKELRNRLLYSFFFLIICFFFFLLNTSIISELLTKPLFNLLQNLDDRRMIFTGLPEVFVSNLKISLFASFIVSLPFFIIQTVLFISPALYKKEKKLFFPVFLMVPILFFLGVLFAYYILIPLIWTFFISFENFMQNGFNLELESRYSEYMKLTMLLLLASGLSFEFPILLIILTKLNILNIKILKNNRKYFFIGILVFSALFTPPDIISQLGIAIPLIIFYEFSIVFIQYFFKK